MKKITFYVLLFVGIGSIAPLHAQNTDGHEVLKKHVNSVVEEVKETETPDAKREYLNHSLDELIETIDRVSGHHSVTDTDKEALDAFSRNLSERKDELNGANGFAKVPDSQLNDYANFIQQDLEQADAVITISATTALLIVIILLLL